MTIFIGICNATYTKKLLSDIKLNMRNFKLSAVKELVSLGGWNSVNSLSQILLSGFDLLIANIFVSSSAMGLLSIAKSIPLIFTSFLGTVSGVFAPKFTILYAKNQIEELVLQVKLSIKIIGCIITVPLCGFIVFGIDFYKLWVSNLTELEIHTIQVLSLLTLLQICFEAFIFPLYNINIITNKLRISVLVTLGVGSLSTIIVFILLKTTNIGVFAIAGVSSIFMTLRTLIFVPIYAATILNVSKRTFYYPLIRGIIAMISALLLFIIGKQFIYINSWGDLCVTAIVFGIIGYALNIFIILNINERKKIFNNLINKVKSKINIETC